MIEMAHDGAVAFYLLVGSVLTLLVGLVALAFYKRAVRRNMRASVDGTIASPAAPEERRAACGPLVFRTEDGSQTFRGTGPGGRLLMLIARGHAFAGAAFGLAAAFLLLGFSGMEFTPLRSIAVAWAFTWPTVLVLSLIFGPDRPVQCRIVLLYLAGIGVLCLGAFLANLTPMELGGMTLPGFLSPALVWAIYAVPSVFLILFLNRAIRTIGPLVLAFVFVALLGSHLALFILAQEPVMKMAAAIAFETGLGATTVFLLVATIGFLIGCFPAWWCAALLRDHYAQKRFSDLTMAAGAIWILQSLVLANSLFREQGMAGVAAATFPFAIWALTLGSLLRPVAAAARERPAQHLLLLRVFGFGRRSLRLLDLLGAHWRPLGSINLISAPDLAPRTVEPSTFILFLRGRMGDLFLSKLADIGPRIAQADTLPDPDGRFRLNQFFCSGDVWKQTITRLMSGSGMELVLMDLRGFGPTRHGCVFELQTLLDTVPLDRLVLLIDRTTDRTVLEDILRERWKRLAVESPNLTQAGGSILLLDATRRESGVARRLIRIAEDSPAARTVGGRTTGAAHSPDSPLQT